VTFRARDGVGRVRLSLRSCGTVGRALGTNGPTPERQPVARLSSMDVIRMLGVGEAALSVADVYASVADVP